MKSDSQRREAFAFVVPGNSSRVQRKDGTAARLRGNEGTGQAASVAFFGPCSMGRPLCRGAFPAPRRRTLPRAAVSAHPAPAPPPPPPQTPPSNPQFSPPPPPPLLKNQKRLPPKPRPLGGPPP